MDSFQNLLISYIIENLLPIFIGIAGLVAWLLDKNKRKAEIDSVKVTNKQGEYTAFETMQNSYTKMVEDMNAKFDELRNENSELQNKMAEFDEFKQENKGLKDRVLELEKQLLFADRERTTMVSKIRELEGKNAVLLKKIEGYEKEFSKYRKENKK